MARTITPKIHRTDSKIAHATNKMQKIVNSNRQICRKVEHNINNKIETVEDLQFLRNSFYEKSHKHGNFWGKNFNLRKHLTTSISANKIHQNLEEKLREEQEKHSLFCSSQYGLFASSQNNQSESQQNSQSEPLQSEVSYDDSTQAVLNFFDNL